MRLTTPVTRTAAVLAVSGLFLVGCTNEPVAAPEPAPSSAAAPAPSSAPSVAPSSSASPGSGTAADVDPAAQRWTAAVCTALTPLAERIQMPPSPDLNDAVATRDAFSSYLGMAVGDAEQAAQDITAAGPPPVEVPGEISAEVSTQVEELRADLTEARIRVDAADPADPFAVGRVVIGAGADVVGSVGEVIEATTAVTDEPSLRPAFEQAPECEPLRTITVPA